MMESTNVTRSLKRLAELETICKKQSEHISEQGKRIAELEAEREVRINKLGELVEMYEKRTKEAEAERDKLRDYAGHTPGCPGMDRKRHPERGCSCGWVQTEAALAEFLASMKEKGVGR